MPITLGSNIASLRGIRQLARTTGQLSTTFERLSSGQRINKASDDAAGLAIADSLNAQSRIFNQGVRNLNDGLSLLSIADSAIETLSGIVIRLQELAEQSANGVYSAPQRTALDSEAHALSDEFFRISKSTELNGQKLFTGTTASISLQAGVGEQAVLKTSVGGAIGTGDFIESPTSFQSDIGSFYSLTLGDLNGDGVLDLVTAGIDSSYTGFATVSLGTGTGTFGAPASFYTEGGNSWAVSLGDLNGDGVLDLLTAGENNGNGYATVKLGDGTGSFGAATSFQTEGRTSYALSLGDLNGDGVLDLVTAGCDDGNNGIATVRLGDGTGSFGAATSFQTEGRTSYALSLGDVNGDGVLDLVTAGVDDGFYGYATVRLGNGTGSFGAATSFYTGIGNHALSLDDLNGDGALDLVAAGVHSANGYATVMLGDGAGSFGAVTSFQTESGRSHGLSLGDLNGDGVLDLVTAGHDDSFNGFATVRLGDGTGSFGAATSFQTEGRTSYALSLGDVNGDGVLDLVTAGFEDDYYGAANSRLGDAVAGVAPLLDFSLETIADARQALPVFKRKREQLAAQRGEIGAFQSRIGVATNVLTVSSENFRAAESRIRDADIADESSRLVRLNILQQAASSVLAQANQQPALALQLLGR